MPNPTMPLTSSSTSRPFIPGQFDVICARGKQAYNHDGNRNFRQILNSATEKYSKVESKLQRSMIVTDIVDAVLAKGNRFLRQNSNGEWIDCTRVMCREKIGHYFRNALGCLYKSNTKSKQHGKKEYKPSLIHSPHTILFSSKLVTKIMERLTMDITFIEDFSDDAFYEKLLETQMRLLEVFKNDVCLVQRYHCQFRLEQQLELASCVTTKLRHFGNASAA